MSLYTHTPTPSSISKSNNAETAELNTVTKENMRNRTIRTKILRLSLWVATGWIARMNVLPFETIVWIQSTVCVWGGWAPRTVVWREEEEEKNQLSNMPTMNMRKYWQSLKLLQDLWNMYPSECQWAPHLWKFINWKRDAATMFLENWSTPPSKH